MNDEDRDNLRAVLIRMKDGSLDQWIETLSEDELHYALALLQNMIATRQAFIDSI